MSIIYNALKKQRSEDERDEQKHIAQERFMQAQSVLEDEQESFIAQQKGTLEKQQKKTGIRRIVFQVAVVGALLCGSVVLFLGIVMYRNATASGDRIFRTASSDTGAYVCSGVLFDGHESVCIINGQFLRQGQVIAGAYVKKISPNKVILQLHEQTVVLPVSSE